MPELSLLVYSFCVFSTDAVRRNHFGQLFQSFDHMGIMFIAVARKQSYRKINGKQFVD